jgi:hypothetical protein
MGKHSFKTKDNGALQLIDLPVHVFVDTKRD